MKNSPSNSGSDSLLESSSAALELDGMVLLPPTSLQVKPGECIAILGENGAGKTTLLRLLTGRVRPTSGTVTLGGQPIDERRREVRREIASLIEAPALYPDLTLIDHLELIESIWAHSPAPQGSGLGRDALEIFGLTALRNRFPHELSSGQRQLVSLAVTFARPARVLLLDEPEQRLDPDRRTIVANAIRTVCLRGAAVVFASHDSELVERVADRSLRVSA